MNQTEWLTKALAAIDAMDPRDIYKGLYGFYPEEYEEYLQNKTYEIEAQYVVDLLTQLRCPYIHIYDGDIQPPSKMFFHYFAERENIGYDPTFYWEAGAEYLDLPEFNLRYLWVNGQGTEHFFQLIEEVK
jgi:hypothetical protein